MENDSRFISWCRNSFALRIIGIEEFLYDIKNGKPVLLYKNMYEIFKKVHLESAHGSRDKCLDNLAVSYSWFNRDLLQIFIKKLHILSKKKIGTKINAFKANYWTRLGMLPEAGPVQVHQVQVQLLSASFIYFVLYLNTF